MVYFVTVCGIFDHYFSSLMRLDGDAFCVECAWCMLFHWSACNLTECGADVCTRVRERDWRQLFCVYCLCGTPFAVLVHTQLHAFSKNLNHLSYIMLNFENRYADALYLESMYE